MKKKDKKESFARWFRRSQRITMGERLFSFLFTLSCGYAASFMLDAAMIRDRSGLLRAGGALLILLMAGLPAAWALSRSAERGRTFDRQRFREELYRRMLLGHMKVSSLGQQEQFLGDIADQVAEQYQERIPKIVEGVCVILGAGVLMCLERPDAAAVFILMGLIQILPVFIYEKWTKKIYEDSWDSDEAEMDWIAQGVDGIRTLKSYGGEDWFIRRYREINRRGIQIGSKSVVTGRLEGILYAAIDAVLRYGSYVILGFYVLYGGLDPAGLPVLVVLSGYVFSSMEKLCTFFRYRATYRSAMDRLAEALRLEIPCAKGEILCAEHIAKSFDEREVLADASLTVRTGERVRLAGGNGSGKSTLIAIILGELMPDLGTAQVITKLSAALQEDPPLSTSAAAFLPALERQKDWSGKRFREHLRAFHFPEELLERSIRELSGGEKKKLFLSVALAREAELLVLDEPTNHLDAESRAYLEETLLARRCAMLICTHDREFALPWDKTLHLEGGTCNG